MSRGFIAVLIAFCLGACHSPSTPTQSEPIDTVTAKAAPEFRLQDVDGVTRILSDYRGKVVVLDFWATWCPPCRREIPDLIALQTKDSLTGFQMLGIALDDEGIVKVKPWVEGHGVNYPTLLPDTSVRNNYGGINSVPTKFFIDRKGRLRFSVVGMLLRAELDSLITPLLKE